MSKSRSHIWPTHIARGNFTYLMQTLTKAHMGFPFGISYWCSKSFRFWSTLVFGFVGFGLFSLFLLLIRDVQPVISTAPLRSSDSIPKNSSQFPTSHQHQNKHNQRCHSNRCHPWARSWGHLQSMAHTDKYINMLLGAVDDKSDPCS